MGTDIITEHTPESIYRGQRLLADQDGSPLERLRQRPPTPVPGATPGPMQGARNLFEDMTFEGVLDAALGTFTDIGRDTFHGIRALFSPGESISAAILSQIAETEEAPINVIGQRMWEALSNQESRNYAGEVAEKLYPEQSKVARAATELGLSLATDPTTYAGLGLFPALRKGIKRVATRKSQGPFTGAVDDLIEKLPLTPEQDAARLYTLARFAEGGDKKAVAALNKELGKYAKEWELASIEKDAYRLTTVGGEGQAVPTKASRIAKTFQAKRKNGDPELFIKELDTPIGDPYRFNAAYLRLNSPDDVLSFGRLYEAETTQYVEAALKFFPEDTIPGIMIREQLKQQRALLGDAIGDVINKEITDIQAFAYRRLLADLGDNILRQVNKSEMKFRSNVDRLRFYKLVGAREQIRAELSLSKNQTSALLGKLTTAADNTAVQVVQAERAMGKLPEILSGAEERYLTAALANLEDGSQATVFLNQAFSSGGKLQNIEKNVHIWWLNSILSGPITHGRNAVVNAANIILKPVEHAAVGDFRAAKEMLIGMMEGTVDVMRVFAARTPKHPQNYQQYRMMHEMASHAPRLSNEALRQLPLYQRVWHFGTANIIGGPTKALGEADAIFKAIAQRQDVRAQAVRLAEKLTDNPTTRKILIDRFLRNPMQLMQQKAFVNAEKMTFQNPLSERATKLQQGISRYPITKWIAPFIKTPLNIVQFGSRYTPFAPAFRQVRQDIVKGGVDADLAIARMFFTPTVMTSTAMLLGDNVTGGINTYNQSNQMPPYSINIRGKWYSYQKIEPLRWTLGVAADIKDMMVSMDWDAADASTIWQQMLAGVAGAYLKPVLDVHFMGGMADVVTAVYEGSKGNWGRLETTAQNYAAGFIPNALSQTNRLFLDNSVRELDTFMTKLKSRIPGLSDNQPPKVGFLGEKQKYPSWVMPTAVSDHRVYREMQHLRMDVPDVSKIVNGHELNMYERAMLRIYRANPWPGFQPLSKSYDDLFSSSVYNLATKEEKKELIMKLANQYNQTAIQRLKNENPRLQKPAMP